ncbi:MAG TPA: cobalamin-independent methionine synthase II family protein [Stellaceae bacterium]|nr:cobalamin-independent methionine synthase II family protein [Stellaceae bacterium]
MTIFSTDRILVTHAGSLPRPPDVRDMVMAKSRGQPYDEGQLARRLDDAVADVVRKQMQSGIDSVNDGELSKSNFTDYVRVRLSGYETRPASTQRRLEITARDSTKFATYFEANPRARFPGAPTIPVCVAPLKYVGHADLQQDIDRFKAAFEGEKVAEAFLPANTPGTIEHWMANEHYKDDEEFVYAIADAMHDEYKAITDSGLLLQIDDPDLPDGWNCLPRMSVAEYRKYAIMRADALNHALRGIPRERVRLHVCWGSFHGPHHDDIPLKDIIDIIFRVRAGSYSIEASNPCHEHEWNVFEKAKLPKESTLVPGVIGHCTDFIEHPDLVAERLVRYARLVGRENVLAGTDCGIGSRVGHESICWAKFEAMAEGARRASKILWARGASAGAGAARKPAAKRKAAKPAKTAKRAKAGKRGAAPRRAPARKAARGKARRR